MFMMTKQDLVPIYLNDIKYSWAVENMCKIIPNLVDQKPEKPKKKQKIIDILVSIGRRSDWSAGGRAKYEWEINPQDFGRINGRVESAYSFKVSHPRCVVQMQVREEDPIRVQSQNTTKC